MHKSIFARPLAAIAAAMAMMTAPVATTTTVSAVSMVTPAAIAVTAAVLTPTSAQAGRRDGVIEPDWDFDPYWDAIFEMDGLVLHEEREN